MPAQSEYRSFLPQISVAKVINYDPDRHGVYIEFPSGQQLAESAKVLINGPADQSRIEQNPLPIIGTWGLVAFPQGDIESAVWLGSFYMSPINAVTTSNPSNPADSQIKYMSHASGAYQILDYVGNFTYWSPDGTIINLNTDNKEPITYQHGMVQETGGQTLVEVGHDYRVPFGLPVFYASITQLNGNSIVMSPGGTVTITGGNPQQGSISVTSQGVITLNTGATTGTGTAESSNVLVINPQTGADNPSNQFVSLIANQGGNQANVNMDTSGNMTMQTAKGGSTINITADGSISITSNNGAVSITANGGDIALHTSTYGSPLSVNDIVNKFNPHVHSGVTPGGGNSGPPTTSLP